MTTIMLSIFVAMVAIAWQYPPDARFMPLVVGIPAIALCLLQLGLDFQATRRSEPAAEEGMTADPRRELAMAGYFIALVAGIIVFGFLVAVPVFLAVFLRRWARSGWSFSLGLAAAASLVLYFAFVEGLRVALHPGFVTPYVLERFSG